MTQTQIEWQSSTMNDAEKLNFAKNETELINEINRKISKIRSYVPKIGVFGNSGVGKSSLCNSLFGKEVAKISDVEACTRNPQEILIGGSGGEGGIILIDVPGIGEDPSHQKEYTALYKSLVPELDLILWAIKADDRNYASGIDAYREIFDTKTKTPVIFVITQTDKTNDVEDWDHQEYRPGGAQINNITIKEHDVSRRFDVSTKNIISIAVSKKGKSYNLNSLVDLVVEVLPNEKKYSFTRETKDENVSQETRILAEKGIWDSIKETAGEFWDGIKDKVTDAVIASAPKVLSQVKEMGLSFLRKKFGFF